MKVMVLQRNCISPAELDNLPKSKSRKADILVLPEGAHHEGGIASLADNALLRELAAVIRKHQLYAVLGTMGETAAGGDHHCTALVVGPSESLLQRIEASCAKCATGARKDHDVIRFELAS